MPLLGRRLPILLVPALVLGLLSGCASGPDYAEIKSSVRKVAPDKARIVFFREPHFSGSLATLRVQIDGTTAGLVPNGSVLSVDRAPGDFKVRVERTGLLGFGHLDFPLATEAGKEYYVELGGKPGCDPFVFGYLGCAMAQHTSMSEQDYC